MLSDELIQKIAGGLDAMPPKPASRSEMELLLARIEAQIRAAQERGCTYAEIAKQITESGYPIKTGTLRVAMQRRRKQEPSTKSTPRRKAHPGASVQPRSGASAAQLPLTKRP
jgi:hypothetical protein